jgi:hypothetical protein
VLKKEQWESSQLVKKESPEKKKDKDKKKGNQHGP